MNQEAGGDVDDTDQSSSDYEEEELPPADPKRFPDIAHSVKKYALRTQPMAFERLK